jgi:hypothetical protein
MACGKRRNICLPIEHGTANPVEQHNSRPVASSLPVACFDAPDGHKTIFEIVHLSTQKLEALAKSRENSGAC